MHAMDKKTVLDILSRFREALTKHGAAPSRLVLYGSHANGTPHEGSDIDVVVISPDFEGKGYWDRLEIVSEAICDLFEPIEAIAMTPAEWDEGESPIASFAREGEVVYDSALQS